MYVCMYIYIYIGIDKFYIELVENYTCNDIYELMAREGYFIRVRAKTPPREDSALRHPGGLMTV